MVPKKKLSFAQMISKLETRFKGKNCSLTIPGYTTVYGLVDEVGLETLTEPTVVIQMNSKRYTVSLECITECLKQL